MFVYSGGPALTKSILTVTALGAIALVAGCATYDESIQADRPGYERVFSPDAMTRGRISCAAIDPAVVASVPGCEPGEPLPLGKGVPAPGSGQEDAQAIFSRASISCGMLGQSFQDVSIVPECFVWRRLPDRMHFVPPPPPPEPEPEPTVVDKTNTVANTTTSVSYFDDGVTQQAAVAAQAGDVSVSAQMGRDESGNMTATLGTGDNQWSAVFDASTGQWSRSDPE